MDDGANVDWTDQHGRTPLHIACLKNHVDVVSLLLEREANVERLDNFGHTPLYLACDRDHVVASRLLLDRGGADVNWAMPDGTTLLWMACLAGHVSTARLLLDRGADVNRAQQQGATPFWFAACWEGHVHAARLCLERGADMDLKAGGRIGPIEISQTQNHAALADWLQHVRAVGWTRYLSEPRYQLVVLRSLVAAGRAQRAASTDDEQLLDFIFPPGDAAPLEATKQARTNRAHLPSDLLPLVLQYYWTGNVHGRVA